MFERKKSAGKIHALPIDAIRPSPFQARTSFDEQELAGLAQSIRENGLLQPISVRKTADGSYELVAGERRLRACKLAKMQTIPAILCNYSDERTAALGLLENLQRENLNPFEQAQGLRDVMVLWDCTQAEAAKRLGMAQPTLANKLRLLQLTTDQRQFVLDNGLTRNPLVAAVAEDGRDGLHPGQLAGTEPPLPCHQLVTALDLPHRDGLQQAVFPDALSQPRQLLFIKNSPSLKRRGTDAFHRQGVDLSGRFLPFKHDSFPFR